MRIGILILGIFLSILPAWSQDDSPVVCLGVEELRVITKMTEDLRYTKAELEVADSIIFHQREVITLKDQTIDLKNQEIQDNLRKSARQKIKVGIISGTIGAVVGVILGIFL